MTPHTTKSPPLLLLLLLLLVVLVVVMMAVRLRVRMAGGRSTLVRGGCV